MLLALLAAQDIVVQAPVAAATSDAIIAGARACMGSTVDPRGVDARLAGWTDTTGAAAAGITTVGRVVARDNVTVVLKPGADGGCVVQAQRSSGFDKPAFLAALGKVVGTAVAPTDTNPVTMLSNGEMLVTQFDDEDADADVQLVFANQALLGAKNHQGK